MKCLGRINSNYIKGIALVSMLTDHVGFFLFPRIEILRIIGRVAFPIFAYFIAEGCHYTRNKCRYLGLMAALGVVCTVIAYLFTKEWYGNVFVTFSLSIVLIYVLNWVKRGIALNGKKWVLRGAFRFVLFLSLMFLIAFVCNYFTVDYGFYGVLLPVFAAVFDRKEGAKWRNMLSLSVGMLLLAIEFGGNQYYSLFSLLILALYNGKRGQKQWKYAFYVFYPLHVAILQGISMII